MYNPICENRKSTKSSNDSKFISAFDQISFCMPQSEICITDVKITSAPKKVCKCLFKCNLFVAIIQTTSCRVKRRKRNIETSR